MIRDYQECYSTVCTLGIPEYLTDSGSTRVPNRVPTRLWGYPDTFPTLGAPGYLPGSGGPGYLPDSGGGYLPGSGATRLPTRLWGYPGTYPTQGVPGYLPDSGGTGVPT